MQTLSERFMAQVRDEFRESMAQLAPGMFPLPLFVYGDGRKRPRVAIIAPDGPRSDSLAAMARYGIAPLLRKANAGLLAVGLTAQVAPRLEESERAEGDGAIEAGGVAFAYSDSLPTVAVIVAIDRYGRRFETASVAVDPYRPPEVGEFRPSGDDGLVTVADALRKALVSAGLA